MNEQNEQVLSAVRNYITETFSHQAKPEMVFHTLEHTEEVVEAASIMADYYNLEEEERLILLIAAWFHDIGYISGTAAGHEEVSIEKATEFLNNQRIDENITQKVVSAISATRMPQSPLNEIEKILCDADLSHLATPDYNAKSQLLRQERESLLGIEVSKREWRRLNIEFLENHKYFTSYGQETLEPRKQENISLLQKNKDKKKKKTKSEEELQPEKEETFPYVNKDPASEMDIKTLQKNTERGIQTMFRTTSQNHFQLSSLADGKANIMISVNAIIISVLLSVLLVRLPYYPNFAIPTVVLITSCLGAMIFAILATRPSVKSGRFSKEDIRAKKTNLLFFGNFHQMEVDEYQWGMNELLKDRDYLYNSMIKDIYFLGVVLAKKYKYLRISYTIFMFGLIASVIAFSIAAFFGDATGSELIDY
jgi:predicted metal-dependent HD superfamily phosphohydrolase